MRTCPESATPDVDVGRVCPARWSGPAPMPSRLGLVIAAAIGGTAAISWCLSAWIYFVDASLAQSLPERPKAAQTARPPVDVIPELASAAATTGD